MHTPVTDPPYLAILEQAHRGGVETQFADVLYLVRELNRQLGGLDLLLRGPAVSCALACVPLPPLTLAGRRLDTLPDARRSLRDLLADGIRVFAEDPCSAGVGYHPGEQPSLLAGVRTIAAGELTACWPRYAQVWFL